jgi:hypothetical protein
MCAGAPLSLLFSRRFAAAVALLLGACATSYAPGGLPMGSSAAQAVKRMGPPTGRHALDGGSTRLEFARGPMGLHTYMLDFDAADRLVRVEQVLTESNFYELRPGMTSHEVLRRIGRPAEQRWLPRQRHRLWSYRYETSFCIWFQVSIGADDRVAELGHNLDPMCEGLDRD